MTASEIIEQIKGLPADQQIEVIRLINESIHLPAPRKALVCTANDGLPIIQASGGKITSQTVREIEALTS